MAAGRGVRLNLDDAQRRLIPSAHICATVRLSLRRSYVSTVQSAPAECTRFGEATSTSTALTPFWCSENRSKSSLCARQEKARRTHFWNGRGSTMVPVCVVFDGRQGERAISCRMHLAVCYHSGEQRTHATGAVMSR